MKKFLLATLIILGAGAALNAGDLVLWYQQPVGSTFNGGSLLINPMRQVILEEAPKARLVQLTVPPVIGAVLLGMEQAGLPIAANRPTLAKSVHRLWPTLAVP